MSFIYSSLSAPTALPDNTPFLHSYYISVGSGLGQVTMMARNTFNASLVFFTMTLIGLTGFLFDQALRYVQKKVLWWVGPSTVGAL